jgi:hypothetical protein
MDSDKQELAKRMAALTQRLKDAMASRKAMEERASGNTPASSPATKPSAEAPKAD